MKTRKVDVEKDMQVTDVEKRLARLETSLAWGATVTKGRAEAPKRTALYEN